MRASRQFVPTSMAALEGRVVLSVVAPSAGGGAAEIHPVHLSPAEIAQSNASDATFSSDTGGTIQSGQPIAEQLTTTYNDGSIQTETLLKVPNSANNTVTSYETINLRNNGGTETVVDTESFSGGTQPFSGDDNTHNITITLPSGSTETQTYNGVTTGNKTVVTGTTHEANGGIETWTSIKIKTGHTTTANKTITEPDGSVEHQKTVTTNHGALDSTSSNTTTVPGVSIERSSSVTNVIRVQPPTS